MNDKGDTVYVLLYFIRSLVVSCALHVPPMAKMMDCAVPEPWYSLEVTNLNKGPEKSLNPGPLVVPESPWSLIPW